jgi:hypothetical protein
MKGRFSVGRNADKDSSVVRLGSRKDSCNVARSVMNGKTDFLLLLIDRRDFVADLTVREAQGVEFASGPE